MSTDIPKEVWCKPYLGYDYVEDWFGGSWYDTNKGGVKYVRADRIEELEERLKAATDDAKEAEAYVEELEAKLAKAVTELRMFTDVSKFMQSSTSHDKRRHNTIITDTLWAQWSKQLMFSHKFLAELSKERSDEKGKNDD